MPMPKVKQVKKAYDEVLRNTKKKESLLENFMLRCYVELEDLKLGVD